MSRIRRIGSRHQRLLKLVMAFTLLAAFLPNISAPPTIAATPNVGTKKYIVFLEGVCSGLTAGKDDNDVFGVLRKKLTEKEFGYGTEDFLSYSYKGGSFSSNDSTAKWLPSDYGADDPITQDLETKSWPALHALLTGFRDRHPEATFVLVGHSLGGVVAFQELIEGNYNNKQYPRLLTSVITIDSPLAGVTGLEKWGAQTFLPNPYRRCLAGSGIDDAKVPQMMVDRYKETAPKYANFRKEILEKAIDTAGERDVKVRTVGNLRDCVWKPGECALVALETGDIETQWVKDAYDKEDRFVLPCKLSISTPLCLALDRFKKPCAAILTGRICIRETHEAALHNDYDQESKDALERIAGHVGPQLTDFGPGTSSTIVETISTSKVPFKPDIVLLADTTGSMRDAIANVRANAASVMTQVKANQAEAQFGVAEYKDFNCSDDPYAFRLNQAITANTTAVQTGISQWSASGGCDTPESQLNALYRLATDSNVGWRSGSTRIVAWFGDAPGHDPSGGHSLSDTINALKAANVRVIAVNTGSKDLDDTNQATRLTQATGGRLLAAGAGTASMGEPPSNNPPPGIHTADTGDDVAGAILTGLTSLPTTITPQVTGCGAGVTVTFDAPSKTVTSGDSVTFTATISVASNAPANAGTTCRIDYLLDGKVIDDTTVTTPIAVAIPARYGLNLSTTTGGTASVAASTAAFIGGTIATISATPAEGYVFVGWTIDGTFASWASTLTITMNADHTAQAAFAPIPSFSDTPAGDPAYPFVSQLAARGIVKGYQDHRYGLNDNLLRAQIAALIVRSMGWENDPTTVAPFSDQGDVDNELWNAVGLLASRGIARGYGDNTYHPVEPIGYAQAVSLVTRSMVAKGLWKQETVDDPTLFPSVPAASGHRLDLITFFRNAGTPADAPADGVWSNWDQQAPRAWIAQVLWQALNSYYGVDRTP